MDKIKEHTLSLYINSDMTDFEISVLKKAILKEIDQQIKEWRADKDFVAWYDREPF